MAWPYSVGVLLSYQVFTEAGGKHTVEAMPVMFSSAEQGSGEMGQAHSLLPRRLQKIMAPPLRGI